MIFRTEYLFRYIWYGLVKPSPEIESEKEFEPNMEAVKQVYDYLNKQKIDLYVVILTGEREASGESVRELPYRDAMIRQLNNMGIKYFLAVPKQNIRQMYHDGYHLTPAGHKWLADEIKEHFSL